MPTRLVGSTVFQFVENAVYVPYPYEVWRDGVYVYTAKAPAAEPDENVVRPEAAFGRKRLTYSPLWISGQGFTVDTQEPLIQLSYVDAMGELRRIWLARGQVTDHRLLQQLGAAGLPINSVNSEDVLQFLVAMEAANHGNPQMPRLRVGHRTGPYLVDGQYGWLIGKQWIGPGQLEADPRANSKYVLAFSPHGDPAAWYAKWREVREAGWVTRFCMGATFAAPLLRLLKCRTFILHHWGESSHGKSALANLAQSAWGNPELLYSSLNRTEISITEIFKHMTDVPALYDERQVSTVDHDKLIYAICTGSGRERGAKDGGLRQDRQQWLTIARTTGEGPLVGGNDLGGQFNRLLQIHSMAFQSKREAESIYPFIAENYGHAGPAFLRLLYDTLSHKPEQGLSGLEILQRLNREMREKLVARIGLDSNHAQYAAIIATAQTLAESWLLDIDIVEAKERALDDAFLALKETAAKKQPTYAERALAKLRDHWISNAGFYVDDTSEEGRAKAKFVYKMIGVETPYGMAFVPHEANELLLKAKFEVERVWRDFQTNDWLVTDGDSPLNRMNLRNGKSMEHPVYILKPEIFFTDVVRQKKLRLINGGLSSDVLGLEVS